MPPKKRPSSARRAKRPAGKAPGKPSPLRIVGGKFRGRKLLYAGDDRVRPMKERVREAVFNLLGPAAKKKHAIDLFAGSGALGLEAISRGAAGATFAFRFVAAEASFVPVAIAVAAIAAPDPLMKSRRLKPGPLRGFCS